jgi:hypothetical protein
MIASIVAIRRNTKSIDNNIKRKDTELNNRVYNVVYVERRNKANIGRKRRNI